MVRFWKLNVTGHCVWSTLREKLQNTARLYTQPAGFEHFSSKPQFEQKSLPQEHSRRQSNQTKNQEINTKSKTRWQRCLSRAEAGNCITVPRGREKVSRQKPGAGAGKAPAWLGQHFTLHGKKSERGCKSDKENAGLPEKAWVELSQNGTECHRERYPPNCRTFEAAPNPAECWEKCQIPQ